MPLGLYISVPFCRTKCSYCNFASDVFSRAVFDKYVARLCGEIERASQTARQRGASFDHGVDTIYFGGGTPTLLNLDQLERLFVTIRQNFAVQPDAEITVECAPGTLSDEMTAWFVQNRVNRVSLGVQSFVDQEARSVGRMHDRETVLNDISRLRAAGISNVNVDLIAGLPHQTAESWDRSIAELIATGVLHASVYMLEVDEDSRLGRELIAGGQKYHAHFVPDEDLVANMYEVACERLNAAGIEQYEISNFARPGFESKHNLKYWIRQPYLGFGVDAHSMLDAGLGTDARAVRFSNPDNLEEYLLCAPATFTAISCDSALEENFFLGLRVTRGVNLHDIAAQFGRDAVPYTTISECIREGLLEQENDWVRLTTRGRLLSNEVFQRFLGEPVGSETP